MQLTHFLPEMLRMKMRRANHLSLNSASVPSQQRLTAFGGRSSTKMISPSDAIFIYIFIFIKLKLILLSHIFRVPDKIKRHLPLSEY